MIPLPRRHRARSRVPVRQRSTAFRMCLIGTLFWAAASTRAAAQNPSAYLVNIEGPIRLETARVVERALTVAERAGSAVVILHVAAAGGRVDAARIIVQEVATAQVPVIALVTSQTWGAAALIGLAADSMFMAPGSAIGAAASPSESWLDMPPEAVAQMRQAFQDAAQQRGLDPQVGAAMVDPSIVIDGVVGSSELLTLGPEAAVRLGVAAAQAGDLPDMLAQLGLEDTQVTTIDADWIGTTVQVANRNFREIVVYLVRSGARFRLGMVTSMQSATFDVPGTRLVPGSVIRVAAEVVGSSERATTEDIRVEPGLVIEWVIENEIIHSNYFVYIRY